MSTHSSKSRFGGSAFAAVLLLGAFWSPADAVSRRNDLPTSATELSSAAKLLAEFARSNAWQNHCVVVSVTRPADVKQNATDSDLVIASEYRRDGERAQSLTGWFNPSAQGGSVPEKLLDKPGRIPPAPNVEPWTVSANQTVGSPQRTISLTWQTPLPGSLYVTVEDRNLVGGKDARLELVEGDSGMALRGVVFLDGRRVDAVLAEAQRIGELSLRNDTLDGEPCTIASTHTVSGVLTAWFLDEPGRPLRRFTLEAGWDDTYFDDVLWKRFRSASRLPPQEYPSEEDKKSRQVWRVDVEAYETVEGMRSPSRARQTSTANYPDGTNTSAESIVTRRRLDTSPDFSKFEPVAFQLNVPNGTLGGQRGATDGVTREWQNGKLVPRVDESAAKTMDQALAADAAKSTPPSPTPSRASRTGFVPLWEWLAASGVLVALFVVALVLWRRR